MDPGGVGSARQDEHRSSAGVLSALQYSCYVVTGFQSYGLDTASVSDWGLIGNMPRIASEPRLRQRKLKTILEIGGRGLEHRFAQFQGALPR